MLGIWGFLVCFKTILQSEGAELLCNSHRLCLNSKIQEQFPGLVSYLVQVLTAYWHKVWVSNWGRPAKAKRKGATVIQLHSLEIAAMAYTFLCFFSLKLLSFFSPPVGTGSCGACDAFASPSLLMSHWTEDQSHPEGSQSSPQPFTDWKGSPPCLAFLRVVSSTQNLLISSCWQCHESLTGRKKSRKPEQRVG